MNFEKQLDHYLDIILQIGAQLKPDQNLLIGSDVREAEIVRKITRKAYEMGVRRVDVDWHDPYINREFLLHAEDEVLDQVPHWLKLKADEEAEANTVLLYLRHNDYEAMKGVDPRRQTRRMRALNPALSLLRKKTMKALRSWCLANLPTQSWAEEVFGEDPEALHKLWQAVFHVMRCDQQDPLKAWQQHAQKLKEKREWLNSLSLKALHFESKTADLLVPLTDRHYWQGGEKTNEFGQNFIANLPTEEVHTMPKKTGTEGWVKNTRPLYIHGQAVDDFTLYFEKGKLVREEVAVGEEQLKALLETDEGARYLGEVALVDYDSPIRESGIVFKDTLFDENASCHLALGEAYPASLLGGRDMNEEELIEAGANRSLIHVDFMIGSEDLQVSGIHANNTTTMIFKEGRWT